MKQPNCENQWHISQASIELERVDYNAITKMGLDNPVSKKIKDIRKEFLGLTVLVSKHTLDAAL